MPFSSGQRLTAAQLNELENIANSAKSIAQSISAGPAGPPGPAGQPGPIGPPGPAGSGATTIAGVTGLQDALNGKLNSFLVGAANGVPPLGPDLKIPAANLPASSSSGGITADYKTPVNTLTNGTMTQLQSHNKIFIHNSASQFFMYLEAVDVGTTVRFIQLGTGSIVFSSTAGGSRNGPSGPYTQVAQSIVSLQDAKTTAGKGAAVVAVLVTPNIWHLSGALV